MNVFDYYDPTDIGASAVLTKGNLEVSILLIENHAYLDTQPSTFSTLVQITETEYNTGLSSTIEQSFGKNRAAANNLFHTWLDKYKDYGFVFKYEEPKADTRTEEEKAHDEQFKNTGRF